MTTDLALIPDALARIHAPKASPPAPPAESTEFAARCTRGLRVRDLNDAPDSTNLAPPLTGTAPKDISTHATFDDGGIPGAFGTQGQANRIDYLLLSPALIGKVKAGGIFRKGVFSASKR